MNLRTNLNTFSSSAAAGGGLDGGWKVTVDRSKAAEGVWTVLGERDSFSVRRQYVLDPLPPAAARRVLVNDTIITRGASAVSARPAASDLLGISVRHRATVAASAESVVSAVVPGAYGAYQCGTHDNPDELCGPTCFDRDVLRTNNGVRSCMHHIWKDRQHHACTYKRPSTNLDFHRGGPCSAPTSLPTAAQRHHPSPLAS